MISRNRAGVLPRLDGVRQTARGWAARCPAHEDRTPSLSVAVGADGRVLLRCWAGCDTCGVVAAMGLTMADLFPAGAGIRCQTRPDHEVVRERALQAALQEGIAAVETRLLLLRRSAERTGLVEWEPWWQRTVREWDSILDRFLSRDQADRVAAWRAGRRWV